MLLLPTAQARVPRDPLSLRVLPSTTFLRAATGRWSFRIPSGLYDVEVIAELLPANSFDQLRAQPFALVFVGSGQEVRFGGVPPVGPTPIY